LHRPHVETAERMEVGSLLVERKLFALAQEEYQTALQQEALPPDHRVYLLESLAALYRAQGRIDEAIRQYEISLSFPLAQEGDKTAVLQARTRSRIQYAEMLHDQGQDAKAAEVLLPLVEPSEEFAEEAERAAEIWEISPKARREYFLAEHAMAQHQEAEAIQHLTAGHQHDPEDVDLLIALHRMPDHPGRALVRQAIKQVASELRSEIGESTKILARSVTLGEEAELKRDLARRLNIYAWLVGNTEGDYEDALHCSERSLELAPEQAGYMDTLARCHYALKNTLEALRFQEMAVDLDPYSGQMNHQLALFREVVRQTEHSSAAKP